jgi:hypothetical protein
MLFVCFEMQIEFLVAAVLQLYNTQIHIAQKIMHHAKKKVQLSLLQALEDNRVVRCGGSHSVRTGDS